ncbi:putative GNAT family acetyltransferase [Annulohypoxylon maeteangense]|uniref:putative GNAT family acetyltransferase n=1 Tax=Annulohypoxylon maeteangense TaxID=1927788 RepID=UPI00200751E0|nr:putative GNAT family acetyltransferase [Annulohypoxylon maeteangense]KAI0883007.1 putative GNAT family acetyltransferase [Annulohypoxylon maeteangense]
MSLILTAAQRADAARIAEIHMAAFSSNAMLLAQFPTTAVRDALEKCIESKAHADINDPNITVLVIRDTNTTESGESKQDHTHQACGTIIAFAKWAHPVSINDVYTESPWIWPEGTNLEVLGEWTRKTEEAQAYAVGVSPCYHLSFIGTDPSHERRGAATMLIQWGIHQSKKYNVPIYLESTLVAAPLYRKLGFVEVGKFSLNYEVPDSGITQT